MLRKAGAAAPEEVQPCQSGGADRADDLRSQSHFDLDLLNVSRMRDILILLNIFSGVQDGSKLHAPRTCR
jgi:hypothetical protein